MLKSELQSILNASGRSPLADLAYLRPDQVPLRYPFSRALTYELLNAGKIKSVLIPGPSGVRGIRLVSVASIEAFLVRLANEQKDESFIPAVAREYNTGRRGRKALPDSSPLSQETKEPSRSAPRGRGRPRKEVVAA